ncbi:hypothetical protein ACLB2K_017516 [Fragaria x ananassa]
MEGSSNPPEYLITGETSRNYLDFMPDDMDELIPEIPIGEEHVEKFMQELYKVMTTPAGSDTSVKHPSWTAAGYAATGWESESCGAAVSDSASSVMAGVEYAGKLVAAAPGSGGRCGCQCGSNGGLLVVAGGSGEGGEINGCGECGAGEDRKMDGEDEEEWFERVMSWGPADLVPGVWNDVHCGGSS